MTSSTAVKAAIYTRISQDTELSGLGVARQEKDCRQLAESLGWSIAGVFNDNDTSAYSGKTRPQYQSMVREIEAGRIGGVLVWDVDRLTRTPRELEDLISWADEHGLALASVGGDIDLNTPQGRLMARLKGSVARHESEQLSRRVRRKALEMAEAGRYVGKRPFGWQFSADRQTLVIDEAEAAIVRAMHSDALGGVALTRIARQLNEQGLRTQAGNPWRTNTIRQVLQRPSNAALKVHQGKVIGAGNWPPLVSREDHDRVVAMLADPVRRTQNRGNLPKHLLSHIATCAECGGFLVAAKAKSHRNLKCNHRGCHRVSRRMDHIDQYVSAAVIELLTHSGVKVLGGDSSAADAARARRDAVAAKMALLGDQWISDQVTGDQFQRMNTQLKDQLEAAEADLRRALPADDGLSAFTGPDASQAWEQADVEQRRAVLRALMDAGLVIAVGPVGQRRLPGQGPAEFDPETVSISWG